MGSGASKNPVGGLPVSPRAEFAEKNAPKGTQPLLIDTPALFDLGHGTVRYRVGQHKADAIKSKAGYFYHPRLDDYSEEASERPLDNFKYHYVYKAPPKSSGKRLFYVYGIGLNSEDQAKMIKKPFYRPKGKGYLWPSSFRKSSHVYYEINFTEQEAEYNSDSDSEDDADEQIRDNIRFNVKGEDTVEKLKKRISVRLLVPVLNVHLCCQEIELSNNDIIGNLRSMDKSGHFKRFLIELEAV